MPKHDGDVVALLILQYGPAAAGHALVLVVDSAPSAAAPACLLACFACFALLACLLACFACIVYGATTGPTEVECWDTSHQHLQQEGNTVKYLHHTVSISPQYTRLYFHESRFEGLTCTQANL